MLSGLVRANGEIGDRAPEMVSQICGRTADEAIRSDDAIDHVGQDGDRGPVFHLDGNDRLAALAATDRSPAAWCTRRTPKSRSGLPRLPGGLR